MFRQYPIHHHTNLHGWPKEDVVTYFTREGATYMRVIRILRALPETEHPKGLE